MKTSNKHRLAYYDIPSKADNVKTFDGKVYNVRGFWVIDKNGVAEKLPNIYYRIRTVKDSHFKTIAKRKNPMSELKSVK
ncbi:hypothetical protein AAV35_011500 [Salimicrobium jeotgali]|uniref:Uncharacterized protein n=1 Tax=Salimicrobium jeotgali TaxID=1230341 RepID=K2FJW2_9BACI|nr:hypothetical protein [Salimicrobium jeotgali]AKG05340.1 hypothetical protein AAV35_011500 [Salimicrobium jeotgali]EKE31346.1 hypothetical protein MJ3_08921 [Salimicrobium jeotgali]MBM7696955.1 hypothetical protein [Salimicrobium jeotgali]